MFRITIDGVARNEPARGRTPEELQHFLTYSEGHKNVRVVEWISGGAKGRVTDTEDES